MVINCLQTGSYRSYDLQMQRSCDKSCNQTVKLESMSNTVNKHYTGCPCTYSTCSLRNVQCFCAIHIDWCVNLHCEIVRVRAAFRPTLNIQDAWYDRMQLRNTLTRHSSWLGDCWYVEWDPVWRTQGLLLVSKSQSETVGERICLQLTHKAVLIQGRQLLSYCCAANSLTHSQQ